MNSNIYSLNGTSLNITSFTGWMSGDANSINGTNDSYNARITFGSTRKVVQIYGANVISSRLGHNITISTRMGQTGSYSGFNCQYWLNTTGQYILLGSNLNISISNSSSSVSIIRIPDNTS